MTEKNKIKSKIKVGDMAGIACPICLTELVIREFAHASTLEEHVFAPNDLPSLKPMCGCSKKTCKAHMDDLLWLHSGDCFRNHRNVDYGFIRNNDGAIPSIQRSINATQMEEERLQKKLNLYFVQFQTEWVCEANEMGKVTSRKFKKISIILRERNGHYVYYIPGIESLLYDIRSFIQALERYKDDENTYWLLESFKKAINRKWNYRLFHWWIWKYYSELAEEIGAKR